MLLGTNSRIAVALILVCLLLPACSEEGETGLWIRIISPKISIDHVLLDVYNATSSDGEPLVQGEIRLPEPSTYEITDSIPENQLWVLIYTDTSVTDVVRIFAVGSREEREVAYGELADVQFEKGKIVDYNTELELTHSGEDLDEDGFYVPDDCDDDDPEVNPEAREVCDGKDNNCNGTDDEGCDCTPGETDDKCWPHWAQRPPDDNFDAVPCKQGLQTCENGLWGYCEDTILPATEGSTVECLSGGYECYRSCTDGVDNNCNGFLDDKDTGCGGCIVGTSESCYTGPPETENVGICHSGTWWCMDGSWGECIDEQTPSLTGEACDGLDNDCNGFTDDFPGTEPSCSSRRGVCAGSKKKCMLVGDEYEWVDCDDNDYQVHAYESVCVLAANCPDDDPDCNCPPGNPDCCLSEYGNCPQECRRKCCCDRTCYQIVETTDFCDMLDNDCNNLLDDANNGNCGCTNGETIPCSEDTGECVEGVTTCINGEWVDDDICVKPTAELCDNLDNNCNESTDEGTEAVVDCGASNPQPNADPTGCSAGVCSYKCHEGWKDVDPADLGQFGGNGCDYRCTETGPERCDGLDNDCDKLFDADDDVMLDILCPPREHATATTCTSPRYCDYSCDTPWDDCNLDLHVPIQMPGDDPPQTDGCEANLSYNDNHCGVCGNRCDFSHANSECQNFACKITGCDSGWADCDGIVQNGCEINTNTNLDHCGECDRLCRLDHASERCTLGNCRIDQCENLWGNCDGSHSSGCETPLDTLSNCGDCNDSCSRAHASATCSGGNCRISSCDASWDNCDGIDWNGCEQSLETLGDCGSCNTPCSRAHATATCSGGNCRISSCDSLWDNCDGQDANGCEESLETLSDCGSCNTTCNRTHATPSCSGGSCHIQSCDNGWDDCDNNDANGCEQDVYTDWHNCGGCDDECNLPNVNQHGCSVGNCTIVSCDGGYRDCDGNPNNGCEININTDPGNCSQCGFVCNLAHVDQHGCVGGSCTIVSCDDGWEDCGGGAADGCEQDIYNDPQNCNGCDAVCDLPQVNQHGCSNGNCTIVTCITPWENCDGSTGNGCEANTQTDPLHCDGCGSACNLPQVDQHGCVNGNCTIISCDGGFDDCNGGPGDGCEINIDNDPLNCDTCGFVCNLPNVLLHGCSGGNCTILSCDPGWGDCTGGAGCETDTTSDENYCGDCSTSCGGTETCCDGNCANLQNSEAYCGNCTTSCAGNETCCFGNCVDTQTDESYCGDCITTCAGNETCCSGGCSFTQTDPFNCGDCGTICEQNHVVVNNCSGGNCTPICHADWGDCDANPNNGCETPLNADDSCGTNCGDIVDCTASGLSCCGGGTCC